MLQTRIADALRRRQEAIKPPRRDLQLQRQISTVFRNYRKKTGLSQEEFADVIEMHRAQYSFVERGLRDFRLSTLVRLAAALETPLWVLIRDAEEGSGEKHRR